MMALGTAVLFFGFYATITEDEKSFDKWPPNPLISYQEAEKEVGCKSNYSDIKKEDIFEKRYENKWFEWSGAVFIFRGEEVSINIDGKGTQDLALLFENKKDGYNLKEDDFITVRFKMDSVGGCFLPYGGKNGILVNKN
jgi:hypothetical protein